MANFDGHQAIAVLAGLAAGAWELALQSSSPAGAGFGEFVAYRIEHGQAGAVAAAAYFGAIAPDIDLKHSMPSKALRVLTAGLWSFASQALNHRGWSHSWYGVACLSALISGVVTAVAGGDARMTFVGALFGCMCHLVLDDVVSYARASEKETGRIPVMVSTSPWYGYESGAAKNWPGFWMLTALAGGGLFGW